jgi:hypothetical protein
MGFVPGVPGEIFRHHYAIAVAVPHETIEIQGFDD